MRKKTIEKYIEMICPGEDGEEIRALDRLSLLSRHYPELAADSILRPELVGSLDRIIDEWLGNIRLDLALGLLPQNSLEKICQTILEVALNLIGVEVARAGFYKDEVESVLRNITARGKELEEISEGRVSLQTAIERILDDAKRVMGGKSMVAQMGNNIEQKMRADGLMESFVSAAKEEIRGNVYYQMGIRGMSKFGNDSATGLRWVRHLGFVQVSSNPVIAARAYEEFPELWDNLRSIVQANPKWQEHTEKYGDELALHGTIVSLLPNLLVFRPIALLSDFHDGLVSYQLNPLNATNFQRNVGDAQTICRLLEKILYRYDTWLGWNADSYQGRPNIVFKVAACSPEAIRTTTALNKRGIGTNNTVTYSVSQEVRLLMEAIESMAFAIKRGILPTQVYETNMIGRTEDHLRETEAERLLSQLDEESFERLASQMPPEIQGSREEKTKAMCSKKYLKRLDDPNFATALVLAFGPHMERWLTDQEEAIEYAGIYVTRRVYQIFFSPCAKAHWKRYLRNTYNLTNKQANFIMDRLDLLPASKRRAQDTYLVLGVPNVTNTEFPNQQLEVWRASHQEGFDCTDYIDSLLEKPDSAILESLLQIEDFVKIYELSPSLKDTLLDKVGFLDEHDNTRGMEPKDWESYGAVQKTMVEFASAYLVFRKAVVDFMEGLAREGRGIK